MTTRFRRILSLLTTGHRETNPSVRALLRPGDAAMSSSIRRFMPRRALSVALALVLVGAAAGIAAAAVTNDPGPFVGCLAAKTTAGSGTTKGQIYNVAKSAPRRWLRASRATSRSSSATPRGRRASRASRAPTGPMARMERRVPRVLPVASPRSHGPRRTTRASTPQVIPPTRAATPSRPSARPVNRPSPAATSSLMIPPPPPPASCTSGTWWLRTCKTATIR